MSMTLYGSLPSPYVRRVRMLLEGVDYQFNNINVYDDAQRAEFSAISPLRKLPVLTDGDTSIFDSHVIAEHIRKKRQWPETTIEQHNLISAIDAVTDSLIVIFMSKRSGIEVSKDKLLFKLQLERLPVILNWLNQQAKTGIFSAWNLATIALISMVDWVRFRELYDLSDYPDLVDAANQHNHKAIVQSTLPE